MALRDAQGGGFSTSPISHSFHPRKNIHSFCAWLFVTVCFGLSFMSDDKKVELTSGLVRVKWRDQLVNWDARPARGHPSVGVSAQIYALAK